jgi:hypothetical protein
MPESAILPACPNARLLGSPETEPAAPSWLADRGVFTFDNLEAKTI